MKPKIMFVIVMLLSFNWFAVNECVLTEEQCYDQIYRECPLATTTFTTKQIQTTQLYLQRRFSTTLPLRAACPISATNPPCIRKDIKCLTEQEITTLTSAWLQLYANGIIANFTKLHNDYWGAQHKFTEGPRWHFWYIRLLEKELQKIDASICMPYWNFAQDFAHPELSIIWDIFGHAGNASNDYCVPDGPFANIQCTFPSEHCLRREWRISPQLDAWKGPEYFTMITQMLYNADIMSSLSNNAIPQFSLEMLLTIGNYLKYILILEDRALTPYEQRVLLQALNAHFDTHLSVGGFNGDMSLPYAPNDPIFFVFHIYIELTDLLWQLSNFNDCYLVPKSYNGGLKYDNITFTRRFADIDTDRFSYFADAYVKESFQFGYGDTCHLYDVIIEPINDLVNKNLQLEAKYPLTSLFYTCVPNLSPPIPSLPSTATLPIRVRPLCNAPPLPTAAQRLKDSLSPSLFSLYYPKFSSNNWSFFDHVFGNISGECNPVSNTCKQMPFALSFQATSNGQRQYEAFNKSVGDYDARNIVDYGQVFYVQFMNDLNSSGYCSPYV